MKKPLNLIFLLCGFLILPFFVGGGQAFCDEIITVKSDETVYSIARQYKITPFEIIQKNNLASPYFLYKNQKIIVPISNKNIADKKKDYEIKPIKDKEIKEKKTGENISEESTTQTKKDNDKPLKIKEQNVIVKSGDTLYSISRTHNISTRELIEINNLKAPFFLYKGMHLKLKSEKKTTYIIKNGDIISNIARKFSIKEEALAKANNLKRPYKMAQLVGRTLLIPLNENIAEENKKNKELKAVNKKKISGTTFVKSGDTLYSIARKYNISTKELIEINSLKAPFFLYKGMLLRLPITKTYFVKKDDTIYSISRKFNTDMHALVIANKMKAPYNIWKGQKLYVPQETNIADTTKEKGSFFTRTKKRYFSGKIRKVFSWPVIGKVLANFGVQGKGKHNDGINIAAKKGASVKASDNGTVLYTGNALGGFGELILLKHNGGWVTAYAHNKKLLVKRGENITKGQIIAHIGETGNVKKPQLHFQIRKNNRVVNPIKYLARRTS